MKSLFLNHQGLHALSSMPQSLMDLLKEASKLLEASEGLTEDLLLEGDICRDRSADCFIIAGKRA